MEYKYSKITTPLGDIFVLATGAGHIIATTNPNDYVDGTKNADGTFTPGYRRDATVLTVRGIEHNATVHLNRQADGAYRPEVEGKSAYENRHLLYVSRRDSLTDPTEATREKIREAVGTAVNAWAQGNAAAILRAEVKHLEDEMDKTGEEMRKATEAHNALAEKYKLIGRQLDALYERESFARR